MVQVGALSSFPVGGAERDGSVAVGCAVQNEGQRESRRSPALGGRRVGAQPALIDKSALAPFRTSAKSSSQNFLCEAVATCDLREVAAQQQCPNRRTSPTVRARRRRSLLGVCRRGWPLGRARLTNMRRNKPQGLCLRQPGKTPEAGCALSRCMQVGAKEV